MEFLLVDEYSDQVHVSTSSAEVIQELEDAFYVEKKKALRHQKCITHRAKVNDSKQYQRKNSLIFKKKAITLYLRNIKYDLKLFQRRKRFDKKNNSFVSIAFLKLKN